MIYPGTYLRLINERTGYGVFTATFIPRGTVVWMHDELDQVISPARVSALPSFLRQQVERYGYVNEDGDLVLCWDHGRYINHSCEPTTAGVGTVLEIARRDIQPGEELTCEYGELVVERFECACGTPSCRGMRGMKAPHELSRRWDRDASEAFAWALMVPQPVLAAARAVGPGAWIAEAIGERRHVDLPSWADNAPGKVQGPQ